MTQEQDDELAARDAKKIAALDLIERSAWATIGDEERLANVHFDQHLLALQTIYYCGIIRAALEYRQRFEGDGARGAGLEATGGPRRPDVDAERG